MTAEEVKHLRSLVTVLVEIEQEYVTRKREILEMYNTAVEGCDHNLPDGSPGTMTTPDNIRCLICNKTLKEGKKRWTKSSSQRSSKDKNGS